ncbi:MAG: hypothetical protein ACXV5H_04765 [Halobacteriota archaeon]
MKAEELQSELKQIGIDVPMGTLGRWAHEDLISGPRRYTEPGKRGHFADWPEASLEETAACWVVRHSDPVWGPPSKAHIKGIREAAHELWKMPWLSCVIEQPPHKYFEAAQTHADHFYTPLVSPYVTPDEGSDFQYVSFTPHALVTKWMAAVEKARQRIAISTGTVIVYDWIIDWDGRDTDKVLHEDQELTYRFNQVLLEKVPRTHAPPSRTSRSRLPLSAVLGDVKGEPVPMRADVWEAGEYRLFHDEVRIFFRVPDFDEDLLKLIKLQR